MSTTSFANTPQAADDHLAYLEDQLATAGTRVLLDVMANDLGGKAKTLFSIDDGLVGSTISPNDLLNADGLVNGVSAWEATASGNFARINNGKIEIDLGHTLAGLGASSINALTATDVIHDTLIYAIRLGNGTLSWAHVDVTIQGQNDAASISGQFTGSIGEDDTTPVTGTLTVVDPDRGESHTQTASNLATQSGLGTYSVDADGHWSYIVNNAAVQYLGASQSVTDSFVVTSLDGTASQTVTVTIDGADDVHVLREDVYASGNVNWVSHADLNGDGYIDLAFSVPNSSQVNVLLNQGDGTFVFGPSNYAPSVEGITIADVNGDGAADLIAANTFYSSVGVFLNNGDGTFSAESNNGAGPVIPSVATYDFNEDGKLDIVSSSYYDGALSILLGNGDGTFQPRITVGVGGISNYGVAVGDFGNGHGDLVLMNIGSNQIYVLMGDGLGRVDKQDSQISRVLIQGSFGGGYRDPRFVERQGMGLS